MGAKPPKAELVSFFDANPGKYKNDPKPDGYNDTRVLVKELLKRDVLPNPVSQPDIPKPMDVGQLYNVLTDAEIQAISEVGFGLIHDAVQANDRTRVKRLIHIAWKKSWIAEQKHDAIVVSIDVVIPDPDWEAQVKGQNDLEKQWPVIAEKGIKGINRIWIDDALGRVE